MAITQTIATLPAVLNDSATFYEDIAERNNSLVTTVLPSINDWAIQANLTQTEINAKAAQVAAQAVDGGYNQNYINDNFVNQNINTLTNKTTPADADEMVIADSASTFSLKKLSFSNLKATLLTYFDTLYSRTSNVFGIGQTWQDVAASRNLGVTYTNNTGKPIMVTVLGISSASVDSYASLFISVSGLNIAAQTVTSRGAVLAFSVTTIVPNGQTYICHGNTVNINSWSELR